MENSGQRSKSADVPELQIVYESVEHEVRRLIARFGEGAVKAAVKAETKRSPGRKEIKDAPGLREAYYADALDWLAGRDPNSIRSNYAIAKQYADKNPGYSHPATMKRIERKLREVRGWTMLVVAEMIAERDRPFAVYLKVLEALFEANPPISFEDFLRSAKDDLAEYETRFVGTVPPDLSIEAVRDAISVYKLTIELPKS